MFREQIKSNQNWTKTVLLLTECWMGAKAAGRFAARMLFDENTRIIVLSTYQPPEAVNGEEETLSPILRQAAEKDIETLTDHLVNEHGVPEKNIFKWVNEGDLSKVIEEDFRDLSNLSVVFGHNHQNPFKKGSCAKIIKTLMAGSMRPIFAISDFITLIGDSKITLFAERASQISNLYSNYLKDIYPDSETKIEIVTRENAHQFQVDCATALHLSKATRIEDLESNTPELLFYEMLEGTEPC